MLNFVYILKKTRRFDIILKRNFTISNIEKSVYMKINVFDGNEPREIHSKNNIFADFLQKSGLYDEIEINEENIYHLIDLIGGKVKIDEFCPCCGEKRVFNIKPLTYYRYFERDDTYIETSLADDLETLQRLDLSELITEEDGSTTKEWIWKNWRCGEYVRLMTLECTCSMDNSHNLDYVVITDDYKMKKIGQFPSVADLSFPELKEYNKILSNEDLKEFKRAIGLFAQGIGVGSFVYLRRIFERIIDTAKQRAITDGAIEEETYIKSHVDERIKMLEKYLPKVLVESTVFYGIVSKGIHELSEQDCILFFPVLRDFIFLILRQWEQTRKEKETEEEIKKSLSKIATNIN